MYWPIYDYMRIMRPSRGREIWVGKTGTGRTKGVHIGGSCHVDLSKRFRESLKAMSTSAEALDLCCSVREIAQVIFVYECFEGTEQKDRALLYIDKQ